MLTKSVPFTFNRSGYFYFTRRVPSDLIHHYSYPRIVQGLRTSSPNVARSRALVAAAKLDEYWSHLRMTDPDLIGKHLLKSMFVPNSVAVLPNVEAANSLSLAQALDSYLLQRGSNKGKTFHAAGRRACSYLVEACGSKQLHEYSRTDALKFREWMVAKGLAGSSITRVLNSLTAIINFAITEYALDIRNSFVGMHIDRRAGVHTRLPIPVSNIQMVQRECKAKDDDVRWLIALMSDTGMRLAEAAGLHRDDIKLDCDIPFVRVQEHSWRRPPVNLIKSLIKKTIYWACLFLSPILSPIQCLSVAILRNGRPPNKYSPITEPHRGGTPLNRPSPTRKPDMRCCSSGH